MSTPATSDHARFAAELRRLMEAAGHTRKSLAEAMGVTPTMVGYWRAGRYLPSFTVMDDLDAQFPHGHLRLLVRNARTGHCPCGAVFDREQSRRMYCSTICQRRAHVKGGRRADPRQVAIDDMCRGCEPEGVCRDDACALRPFSPYLVVPFRRRSA